MTHHHITRVLYIVMIAAILSTGATLFIYSQAMVVKADDLLEPFTQYAATVENPFEPPDTSAVTAGVSLLACPTYILMDNDDITPDNPYPTFGLFYLPGEAVYAYDDQSLYIPDTDHIGGYLTGAIDPACGVTPEGGPVFFPFFDGEANLDGGSLGPNF